MAESNKDCRVREVECRSVLNKSGLSDYAVNCYAGCRHGCVYCYARFATRFSHPGEAWGSFVDVKVNAPKVLAREAPRKKPGRVFISSVCDGWQPEESAYRMTGQCLEVLLHYHYPLTVLTKSKLAGRDLELLASARDTVEFGVTITTFDENIRRFIEPGSSPSYERLNLLQEAKRRGIRTYAFLGPLLPGLSDDEGNLNELFRLVREAGVDYFYVDRLNRRFGVWPSLKGMLQDNFRDLVEVYRKLFFDDVAREKYTERLMSSITGLARRQGLESRMKLCF